MRDIPILVLLSFPSPNYVNPHTQGKSLIVVNSVFSGLVFAVVVLRLYTRIFLKRWMGSDDYAIIAATIFTLGLNAAVILANARYYWDRHIYDIPLGQIHHVGKIAIAAKALFVCAAFFTRISLLCFYYRLTIDTGLRKYRSLLHATMIFNLALFLAFLPLCIFQCRPIRAYWTFPAQGKCIDEGASTLAAGITNCVADLLVTVLPIPMVMRLKLPLKQRLGVSVLFGLGFIVTTAGIVRTYYIWKALVASYDETWYAYPLWICAAVEIDLAVLCACAPTLRPLLIKLTKPVLSSISDMYDRGASAYATKTSKRGVLSSNASRPTLEGNTVIGSSADYELGKIGVLSDVEEVARPSAPRRNWSQTWKKSPDQGPELGRSRSPKLDINYNQTFEVKHEDRSNTITSFGPSTSYLRLEDSSHELRNQWEAASRRNSWDKDKRAGDGHERGMSTLQTHGLVSLDPLSSKKMSEKYPTTSPDPDALRNDHANLASPGEDSFYLSAASNDSSLKSKHSTEWPWRPNTATSAGPELRNGERRWDIERNPFQDGSSSGESKKEDKQRALPSPGLPGHSKTVSVSDRHREEIEARKQSLSIERSNSRKKQVQGIARVL